MRHPKIKIEKTTARSTDEDDDNDDSNDNNDNKKESEVDL